MILSMRLVLVMIRKAWPPAKVIQPRHRTLLPNMRPPNMRPPNMRPPKAHASKARPPFDCDLASYMLVG